MNYNLLENMSIEELKEKLKNSRIQQRKEVSCNNMEMYLNNGI